MSHHASSAPLEKFTYDDAIVRKFVMATVLWGFVGMLVGILVALQLALPLAVCLQVVIREVVIRDLLDPWRADRGLRP